MTLNLHGPSSNPLLPRITPEALDAAVNAELSGLSGQVLDYGRGLRRMRLSSPAGFGPLSSAPAFTGNLTKSTLYQTADASDWVRLIMRSSHVTGPMTLKAYIAPTSQIGNGWSAYDAAGVANTSTQWTPVTFSAGCLDVNPEDTIPGTTTGTVPNDDNWYFSDWVLPASLPRIDGGEGRLLLVRASGLTNPSGTSIGGAGGLLADPANIANSSSNWGTSGSPVDTLTATDFTANGLTPIWALQWYSRLSGFTVLACGSSIMVGTTTTNDRSSWNRIACRQLSIDTGVAFRPMFISNVPIPTTALWVPQAIKNIKAFKPDIVLLQVSNRNDANTAAQQDITWASIIRLVEMVRSQGGRAILVTSTPWPPTNAPTAVEDGYRQINNNRARASGLPVIDYDAVVSDGGSPARILPIFNASGDQTHPSNTGHAAAALVAAPLIARSVFVR